MTDIALSSAVSSLLLIEKQMGVASNNIANANTVGYTKETVTVGERVTGGVGSGVTDLGTVSNIDQYLQAAVLQSNSSVGAGDGVQHGLSESSAGPRPDHQQHDRRQRPSLRTELRPGVARPDGGHAGRQFAANFGGRPTG